MQRLDLHPRIAALPHIGGANRSLPFGQGVCWRGFLSAQSGAVEASEAGKACEFRRGARSICWPVRVESSSALVAGTGSGETHHEA